MATPAGGEIFAPRRARRRRGPLVVLALLVALAVVGAAVVAGWMVHDGRLALPFLPAPAPAPPPLSAVRVAAMEARLAAIDRRIAQTQAEQAPLAARTVALFTAFAARRTAERGQPLGYLEGLLRQHFTASQPRAVALLITNASPPITQDMLADQLVALAPPLASHLRPPTLWERLSAGFSGLLILRREAADAPDPALGLNHAMVALREGRLDLAMADVQRLPASRARDGWLRAAARLMSVEAALDTIETEALAATSPAVVQPPLRSPATYRPTFPASTSSGTLPPSTTAWLKSRRS